MTDILTSEAIASMLDRPMKVLTYPTVDSTNNEAKRQIAAGLSEPALIIAETQTAGKGRLGRSFYSPAGTGLYMSIILHPNAPAAEWLSITSAAAVALCLAIEELSDAKPSIKWVNDIYLHGRKISGILTESVAEPSSGLMKSVIVGIGINLSTASFPADFADRAASLYGNGEPAFSRNRLAATVCNRLLTLAEGLSERTWLEPYRHRAYLDGKEIVYYETGVAHSATVLGIDEHGGLIVADSEGTHRTLFSGEVTVRLTDQIL